MGDPQVGDGARGVGVRGAVAAETGRGGEGASGPDAADSAGAAAPAKHLAATPSTADAVLLHVTCCRAASMRVTSFRRIVKGADAFADPADVHAVFADAAAVELTSGAAGCACCGAGAVVAVS